MLGSFLALTAALVVATSGSATATDPVFYFKRGLELSSEPPSRSSPGDEGTASLLRRRSARLATFISAPLLAELSAGDVTASLFLVARRTALDGCAVVTVRLLRMTTPDEGVPLTTTNLTTSILRRRSTEQPIVVVLPVAGTVASAGERIGLEVSVGNECEGPRTVSLLYDALDSPSRIMLSPFVPVVTTSTTLPPATPPTCEDEAPRSLERLLCRIVALETVLRAQTTAALGGLNIRRRLFLRLDRARAFAATAAPAAPGVRAARRALRATRGFDGLVRRAVRRGQLDGGVAGELRRLAGLLSEDLRGLRAGVP